MPRLSSAIVRPRAPAAWLRTRHRQCSPRGASFPDQASSSARTQAPWRMRRKSHGPSPAREYWPRRRTGIGLHRQVRSRRSIPAHLRLRFPPRPAPRQYCRSDAPVLLKDRCHCNRNNECNSRWRMRSSRAAPCDWCQGLLLRASLKNRMRLFARSHTALRSMHRVRSPANR